MKLRWAAAAVAAGCLLAVSAGCSRAASPEHMPGKPAHGAAASVVTYEDYSGTAIVSADGRTVTVGRFSAPCLGTARAVARETTARVELWLRETVPARPGVCNVMMAIANSQAIRLKAPLGRRRLTDGATGRAIAWISARLILRPTALPAGYRLRDLAPVVDFTAPELPGPAGCTQFYAGPLGENSLVIEQSAGRLQMPGPGPEGWTAIRVRGLPGQTTRNLITWRENGLTDLIMVARPQWTQVLTTTQLVAMADSA
jgi:hypothetical protein